MRKKNFAFSRISDTTSSGSGVSPPEVCSGELSPPEVCLSKLQTKLMSELEKIQVKPKYIKINFKK
jgi:hypothetical protein